MPVISIIIPVYNVAQYLNRCLDTVVSQTHRELEIILVDDGSTDGSSELCETWAAKDDRIVVIHQKNSGAAVARNRGLDRATGKYIMFVDADDYVTDNLCSVLLTKMDDAPKIDCVICGLDFVSDDGRVDIPQAVDAQVTISGMDALKERYIQNRNCINIIGPCGKLFRRQLWDDLRFTDGMYYEDLDIAPYIFVKCRNILCIPEIGYFYYQRADSASHSGGTDDKRVTDSLLIREKHIAFYEQIGQPELADAVRRMLLDLIITSKCNGWIPAEAWPYARKLYRRNSCRLIFSKHVSLKDKIRFSVFSVGGKTLYMRFAKGRNG